MILCLPINICEDGRLLIVILAGNPHSAHTQWCFIKKTKNKTNKLNKTARYSQCSVSSMYDPERQGNLKINKETSVLGVLMYSGVNLNLCIHKDLIFFGTMSDLIKHVKKKKKRYTLVEM